jgi:hypothetical protein
MTTQGTAKLRVCASCEWVFKLGDSQDCDCPKCGFGSYGARYVYGDKAYTYKKTQKPWKDKVELKTIKYCIEVVTKHGI